MKTLHLIRHLSTVALLTLVVVLVISHTILLFNEVRSIKFHISDYSEKVLSELNAAMADVNYVRVREILGLVRDDRTENLVFESPQFVENGMAPIELGQLKSNSIFTMSTSVPMRFQGANLGQLRYEIDLLQLSYSLFLNSLPLYLFLTFVFCTLILFSNLSIIQLLYKLETLIRKTANRSYAPQGLNKDEVVKSLPSFLAGSMLSLAHTVEDLVVTEQKFAAESAKNEMALQVAHDIRSPLSALNMIVATLKEVPEEKRLIIRNTAQRISDIANGLLEQSKKLAGNRINFAVKTSESADVEPVMLIAFLDAIVSEKRVQFRERMEVEIIGDLSRGYGMFAKIDVIEFGRVISNLINNSIEAISGPGRVTVAVRDLRNQIAIIIADNGKGIPSDLIANLGERGITYGKEGMQSGSGLGIFHAQKTLESAGGSFQIQSKVGQGTIITMTLPHPDHPFWFANKLLLKKGMTIVSVDDDQTIHQIWSGRLVSMQAAEYGIQHLTFSSLIQFEEWARNEGTENSLYLVDYEFFRQNSNGLESIERTGIAKFAVLVTSRYEEPQVRSGAQRLGVKVLPKSLAPFIPIEIDSIGRE